MEFKVLNPKLIFQIIVFGFKFFKKVLLYEIPNSMHLMEVLFVSSILLYFTIAYAVF